MTRLLQIGLIKPHDLHRKYTQEMFANEIVLLSYYIAAINIETVYSEVAPAVGAKTEYVSFDGIALTDTFQLNESDGQVAATGIFPENHERVVRQKNQDIRVIVMNPPYSAGQTSANDNNQNQKYPVLDASISSTYGKASSATSTKNLRDSYIRAIRWASLRIKNNGVIAFVSNGSFIDSNAMDGIRKTFVNEFSQIFVYNLRGNARTSGEQRKKESGNVFGSGARTPIALCVLIKNVDRTEQAELRYRDIGDYLTREAKLDILKDERSIEGTPWELLTPNDEGDWINVRDDNFDSFQPIGDKRGKGSGPIFDTFSIGLASGRDSWVTNYSPGAIATNVEAMVGHYNDQVKPGAGAIDLDPTKISWNRNFDQDLRRGTQHSYKQNRIVPIQYRPYSRQFCYFDRSMNAMVYQLERLFPTPEQRNLAIAFPGPGAGVGLEVAALMVDRLMDKTAQALQLFPMYSFRPAPATELPILEPGEELDGDYIRRENITDATLMAYRGFYEGVTISKEDIFYYVYGLLHSPTYKETYKADLTKMLPRIPKVKDFWGFSTAGRTLADLHLNYETVKPAELAEVCKTDPPADVEGKYDYYRVQKLSWGARKDRSRIVFNSNITLESIPAETLDYQVNGKPALEWIIDRYQVTTHKDSQITNDPNDYCREVGDPRYIIDLIKRIVTVSLETNKIVAGLPTLEIVE